AKLAEEQRWNHVLYASSEMKIRNGYYYDPRRGVAQPALDLPMEQVAERDIIRMRFMPKSPREDAIIADALLEVENEEAEADAWYEKVNNMEVPTDARKFDPVFNESPGMQHARNRGYVTTAKKIFLERLKHYNEVWQKAEEKVEGLMEAIGIKIGFCHESVGLPRSVQRAAEGDAEAIKALKSAVKEMQANKSTIKSEAEKKEQLKHALNTPYHVQALAIFLAFSSLWTCTSMVFAVGHVSNVSSGMSRPGIASRWHDTIVPHDVVEQDSNPVRGDNTLSPLDTVKIGILTHHGLPGAGDAHAIPDLFCHFSPRGPAPGLKRPGLNEPFSTLFSTVPTDTG
ncbi:MAG: hypothetical protein JNJ77_00015, partial [Planctomycetia bacterium]|nr:hypothetical protein [Planctomycetia bacterium]